MSDQFISEIRIFSFNFAPRGWAFCNGQLLAINQNQALFSLLGTTYGGNGQTTFGLPNLQGRVSMGVSTSHTLGQSAGEESHTIIATEMPAHIHPFNCATGAGTSTNPAGNFPASAPNNPYAVNVSSNVAMAASAVSSAGGNLPHENRAPFLALNFCIALQGIFPSRS